jgi:hypothetical protein
MRILLPVLALLAAAPAGAQGGYRAQPDTLFVESLNPYRMWFVRGGDTLGNSVRSLSVERQVWRTAGDSLVVPVVTHTLNLSAEAESETLGMTRRGHVTSVDGQADKVRGRYDFVLRLPPGLTLAEGTAWADTNHNALPVEGGDYSIRIVRELRVERLVDSLGSRVAVVRGTGTMQYHDVYPSEPGRFWWLDVTGPVRETFVFDVRNGRQVGREWWMDLRGTAGFPETGGAVDTVPAGLFSADTSRMISAERARLLTRALPAGDTTHTYGENGPVLLHAVRRTGDTMESGALARDGTLTTVRSDSRGGVPIRFELLRTAGHQEPWRRTLAVEAGHLRVTGSRDTVLAIPAGAWTIGGEGMHEHLAAALAHATLGTDVELAVLDPFTLGWERVRARVVPFEDVLLGVSTAKQGNAERFVVMLISKGGELLYAQGATGEAMDFTRAPAEGSPVLKRVGRLLDALESRTPR